MEFLLDFILHIDQYMIDIVQEYHTWAYVILFIIIFCETGLVVTPFLPGDSLLFVAGAISALPDMPLEVNILALVLFISAVLGDSCNYMIGHFFGRKLFNNPDSRIFKQSHLEKTHEFYKKYGGKTIILARFVPIVRTFAPFVAGMGKMHYYYFMVYNLIGGALWVGIFCYAGIFITIAPVLAILKAGSDGSMSGIVNMVHDTNGAPIDSMYFWMTGALSAFLDNAPTYLVFFNLASGDAHHLMTDLSPTLLAISMGSVFMGAVTYIGNAPNFMVKSIATQAGVNMPTFFGYMKWSVIVLVPVYVLLT